MGSEMCIRDSPSFILSNLNGNDFVYRLFLADYVTGKVDTMRFDFSI